MQKLEATFTGDQAAVKATLGDYIRLVQLRKELDDEEPREIRVTWVEGEAAEKKSETKFDSEE